MSDKVHGNKGRKPSEERWRKNREAMEKIMSSDETKKKWSDGHSTPEAKERVSKQRSELKFPRKDTKPEIILQEICQDTGIQFIKRKSIKLQHYDWHAHGSTFVDVFIEPNICLFADGDYWHANPNLYRISKVRWHAGIKPDTVLVTSSKEKKIAKNIRWRDKGITLDLIQQGYTVIRFWQSDLLYDIETCCQKIIDVVRNVGADQCSFQG